MEPRQRASRETIDDLIARWTWSMDAVLEVEKRDTKHLKVVCSEIRNLKPLTSLCLKSIALNMDNIWCKDYMENWSDQNVAFLLGPFDDLPGSLVSDVIQTLREMNMLFVRFLLPLITCHVEYLNLSNFKGINKVLVAIKYRCQKALKSLNLEHCKGLSVPILKETLSSLQNLHILNLKHVGVGDDVLATLGSNNVRLSELYVCHNINISNTGIKSLCEDDGHLGKCKNLAVLTVDFTKVDAVGLLCALENLPKLKVLEHSSVCTAALQWFYNHVDSTLKLQQMTFDMSSLNNTELNDLVAASPNLKELVFQYPPYENDIDISPFLQMKCLTKFKSENSVIPEIPWFMHLGHSLTNLSLVGDNFVSEIDLTILGKSCPMLEKLNIQEIILVESEFNDEDHFKSMKYVNLNNEKHAHNMERNLHCILSSVHLQSIIFKNFKFSDSLFYSVIEKRTNNRAIFSQLREIDLIRCNKITAKVLRELLCFAPRLFKMSLNHCEEIALRDAASLRSFIFSNGNGVQITWA